MQQGGLIRTASVVRLFRYASLFIPVILLFYGVMIQFSYIAPPHDINVGVLFILSLWWIFLSFWQFFVPIKSGLDGTLRIIAYHLTMAGYLIFISGIASPLGACWLILMLVGYAFYGNRGLVISTISFFIVVIVDILLWTPQNHNLFIYDLVALLVILFIGFIVLGLNKTQEVDKDDLKKTKQQEQIQRDRVYAIINNMSDAVLSLNRNREIRLYNAACLNLLDTNVSLIGQKIENVLSVIDSERKPIDIDKCLENANTVIKRDDLIYTYSDGEEIKLEITYAPIKGSYSSLKKSETNEGFVIIMRDITKQKSLEEERDEFISVVSHELRTPITIAEGAISNAIEMIGHPNVTNEMIKDSVSMAHDQAIFLASMVNDLSTLSRAERGVANDSEVIDATELGHKLYEKYHESANEKGLRLNLDLGPNLGEIYASRLYIEELLQNFITNSIKYTKEGSVTIIFKKKGHNIDFSIKDTGIGISKSDQAKIFQKFYRSEDYRTRETSGTGLGLYVSAKLAKKIGCKINVQSRLNHGSTFSISIPTYKKK